MFGSFEDDLKRFTPTGVGLDRDSILVAAGRASVRPQRRWQVLAGALAVTQLLTLVVFWPGNGRVPRQEVVEKSAAPTAASVSPAPADAMMLGTLRREMLEFREVESSGSFVNLAGPDDPPLRAFGGPENTLVN